ncbi:chemotaxis protein CheB [Chitinophaga sp. 30R24]|uniref:chemotaxis protein CheB n=1 Tax=Chitinophaga sp. 30R24 TaxID=3248838 RepID=UPI003B90DC88
MTTAPYLIVIGGSAGGLQPILTLLPGLVYPFPAAIIIVLHRQSQYASVLIDLLSAQSMLPVKEAAEKEPLQPGVIYVAPVDYHLLVEKDHTLSLDYSEKVNFSRPSIDVTFATAALAYGSKLAVLLLSGANIDGIEGLIDVHEAGGTTAVQHPDTADVDYMPRQAIEQAPVDHLLLPKDMAGFMNAMAGV